LTGTIRAGIKGGGNVTNGFMALKEKQGRRLKPAGGGSKWDGKGTRGPKTQASGGTNHRPPRRLKRNVRLRKKKGTGGSEVKGVKWGDTIGNAAKRAETLIALVCETAKKRGG